jgi:hypothetical protein
LHGVDHSELENHNFVKRLATSCLSLTTMNLDLYALQIARGMDWMAGSSRLANTLLSR